MRLILEVLIVLLLAGCTTAAPPPLRVVDNTLPERDVSREAQGWRLIDRGALLIDVRDPEFFEAGHLHHAINIPLPEMVAGHRTFGVDKKRLIVVYGSKAQLSGVTMSLLIRHGYANAHNAGSYESMQAARP